MKNRLLTFSLLLLAVFGSCPFATAHELNDDETVQENTDDDQDEASKQEDEDDSIVILPVLKGMFITGNPDEVKTEGLSALQWVHIQHAMIPGDPAQFQSYMATRFLGKPLTRGSLKDIKQAVFEYFSNQNRPFVDVTMPQQDITEGVLQIVVTESTVGEIYVHKATWFSKECLQRCLRVTRGSVIDRAMILEDLEWLNRNPYRRTEVVFTPGLTPETTNIEFYTFDKCPLRIYGGWDNYGNEFTGEQQGFVGFNWGNVLGLNHLLAYQYTFSTGHFSNLQAHTANYNVPLPWRHELVLFGGYSHVRAVFPQPPLEPETMHHKGFGVQLSGRYHIPICIPDRSWLQDVFVGYDYKKTNTNLTFADTPIFANNVNLTQYVLGYQTDFDFYGSNTQFQITGFCSPNEWLPDQTNADFQSLRPGAHNTYAYVRSYIENTRCIGYGFSLYTFLEGQLSDQNLLPSEQYGLGGHESVRGYAEREVNGDNAFFATFQLQTPTVSVLQWVPIRCCRTACDGLVLLAFLDYGVAANYQQDPLERNQYLVSVGPGLRYVINTNFVAEADWGFQLHRTDFNQGFTNRVHFSLIASW